jgi:hypothetical protein
MREVIGEAMRKLVALAVAAAGLCALAGGYAALLAGKPANQLLAGKGSPVWTEVRWPFLVDQWGEGKAFQCAAAACGTEVNLYLRPKIGFCNCTKGVADDEELARVEDVELVGKQYSPLGPGRAVTVGWMHGRSRPYVIADAVPSGTSALAIAFNDRCDAIVATVVVDHGPPAAFEPAVLAFLNNGTVLRWAEAALGR